MYYYRKDYMKLAEHLLKTEFRKSWKKKSKELQSSEPQN